MKKKTNKLVQLKQWILSIVSVSGASSDVGKCTTCRFNNGKYDNCTAGTYWAEQGLNRMCCEGELWEATER